MAFWTLRVLLAGTAGSAFNVGSPVGIRLKDLAEKIAGNFPVPVPVECRGLVDAQGKRSKMIPDVSAAETSLGLSVKVNLDSAIRRTLQWNQHTCVIKK
jgi:nucleoside-diphosphate-sugar epimerase